MRVPTTVPSHENVYNGTRRSYQGIARGVIPKANSEHEDIGLASHHFATRAMRFRSGEAPRDHPQRGGSLIHAGVLSNACVSVVARSCAAIVVRVCVRDGWVFGWEGERLTLSGLASPKSARTTVCGLLDSGFSVRRKFLALTSLWT